MAYLIIAIQGKKKKLEIKRDIIFIGRGAGNQLPLDDPSLADQHCQILRTEGTYRIIDLGSESGTQVNGNPIDQVDLKDGDIIQIGNVRMAIKDIPAPDPASPQTPASLPSGARRRAGGPSVRKARAKMRPSRSTEKVPLTIKAEYAAASEGDGERLVRRKLRQGSGMPGWAVGVLGFWGAVVVIAVVIYMINQAKPSPYQNDYFRAVTYESQGDIESALEYFQRIPIGDPDYGKMANEEADRIVREFELERRAVDLKAAMEYFSNNIKGFIKKYLDAPNNAKQAQRIERDYKADRKSYIRVLITCRIDHYIKRYPEGPDLAEAKKIRKNYLQEIDLKARMTFRDTEVEADTELSLKKYGAAYTLMANWEKKYPETKFKERIAWMKNRIWDAMMEQWKLWEVDALKAEKDGNYKRANGIYHRYLSRCEGYSAPEAKALIQDWQNRVEENIRLLEEKVGVKVRERQSEN